MTTPEKDNCSSSSSSHYALHVALQTMKERCQSLQKRLSALEEENLGLRMGQTSMAESTTHERRVSNQTELEVLREKVSELSRQKIQLTDHISMVASENRQLWSRLSKLTKDNQELGGSVARMKESMVVGGGSQNLIRSKTFTKNAPNPKLRDRLPREGGSDESSEEINLELEDVSLLNKCGFIDSGSGAEMGFLQHDGEELLMFDLESNPDAKRCTEGLLEIQKELLRQQTMLKIAAGKLQTKQEICNACKHKKTDGRPQMVDKTVEVGTDLPLEDRSATTATTHSTEDLPLPEIPTAAASAAAATVPKNVGPAVATTLPAPPGTTTETEASTLKYINILQEKVKADAQDKMCPMCGKIYVKNVSFDEFQEHVEGHFIDDNELELSLDRTYEYISQTVGNF